jgi:hypothetical protein
MRDLLYSKVSICGSTLRENRSTRFNKSRNEGPI